MRCDILKDLTLFCIHYFSIMLISTPFNNSFALTRANLKFLLINSLFYTYLMKLQLNRHTAPNISQHKILQVSSKSQCP